jgi:predicted nucleotidyltransferase
MALVAPPGAPTREDAAAAAMTLIAAGVEEVLLFGSVARGAATPDSDIDLVALFADLDYSRRRALSAELAERASAAVDHPVHVHVSDRPEWCARVERVVTSFEHRIAADAVVVAQAAARGAVDWGKEMVLAMSDPAEALRHFTDRVLPRLQDLASATRGDPDEGDLHVSAPERELARLNRLVRVCTASALTAETSLKALAVLYRTPTPAEKDLRRAGHDAVAVLDLVPEPARSAAAAVFDRRGIDLAVLSSWRWRGTYADDVAGDRAAADALAAAYATMAPEIAGVLSEHLQLRIGAGDGQLVAGAARLARLSARIAAQDVRSGRPAGRGLDVWETAE